MVPALRLPDGIPSPAATLSKLAPWQGSVAPGGNPLLRDVTFQIEPWLLYLRGELRAGRLPFWNPHQSAGAPFWANGQSAPLFPLHLLFVLLPVQIGFVLLPWLRIVIGGCGTWRLGRELGLSERGALLAAVIFPLSGMLVSFASFPMGNALALVPWVLWALERLVQGGSWRPLAIAGGLQALGGHPETVVHTALLGAVYLMVRGARRAAWGRATIGAALGLGLAAVQWMPVLHMVLHSAKWAAGTATVPALPERLVALQPLRLVLPQLYGQPALGTWWGPFNYSATAVYAGALALPLAGAGAWHWRRDRRGRAILVLLVVSAAIAYHLPGLQQLLAETPGLGRVAQHRLIFGVELALALLAGAGVDAVRAGEWRGALGGSVLAGSASAAAWILFRTEWIARGLAVEQIWQTVTIVLSGLLVVASTRLAERPQRVVVALLPLLAAADLVAAHAAIHPGLSVAALYPDTRAVDFLRAVPDRFAAVDQALRPNAAMTYGLTDLRGDDPLKLLRFERVYGGLATPNPVYFEPILDWTSPWLDDLAVRWVLAGPDAAAPVAGWRLAYAGDDARIFERPTARPLVRLADADGSVRVAASTPGAWDIVWSAPRATTLVVAEVFDEGWRARSDGRSVPVVPWRDLLLGVGVGPGVGRVELRYVPPGIVLGTIVSLLALALVALRWRRA